MNAATLRLRVDGREVTAAPGTSVAALLAQLHPGPGLPTRRSVRGEPRAPLCGMGVCQECRVGIDGQRRLACQTLCHEGMVVSTIATVPGDGGPNVNDVANGAGAAAMFAARAPAESESCDLLVIGAGPAGLAAAAAAAPSGARIVVVDDNPAPGGQIWRHGVQVPATPALKVRLAALERHANITLLSGTRVLASASGPALLLEDATQARLMRYRRLLLCTGARELLLPFPGWTLPGVTGAGGLQALVKGGLPVRGQRVVLAGSGPLLLATAATLRRAGAKVLLIAEQAAPAAMARFALGLPRWPGKFAQALRLWCPQWQAGRWVSAALGDERLQAVVVQRPNGSQGPRGKTVHDRLACDRLACGFGLVPNVELGRMIGIALDAGGALAVDELQLTSVEHCLAAGECTGIAGQESASLQGAIAGHVAVGELDAARALAAQLPRWQIFARSLQTAFALRSELRALAEAETIVCRCEDVPHAALQSEPGWIEAKLRTRCGMGPCQGRICGAAAQVLYGWAPPPAAKHLLGPVRIASLS